MLCGFGREGSWQESVGKDANSQLRKNNEPTLVAKAWADPRTIAEVDSDDPTESWVA